MSDEEVIDARTAVSPAHKTETAYHLPLDSIRPSPYNPRRRFDEASLDELADSIAAHGVQQAIVVRLVEAAKPGGATHEIVAGERRWRASRRLADRGGHAAPHTIPSFIRDLDDFAAREISLTENSHRNDLHPLEEAQTYDNLLLRPVGGGEFDPPRTKGYSVEQLAEKIGHKPNFVFGRLKLLDLTQEAKDSFLDGNLQLKIAEALARMPAKEQERALPQILDGWAGEPFSHRQAVAYLRQHYMLLLKSAPFQITDPDLVAAAGPCTTCPKRSGASPDLFGDSKDDMCLDSECFDRKKQALADQVMAKARDAGKAVLVGKAAEKVVGKLGSVTSDYTLQAHGHVNLDRPAPELTGTKKTLRTLLGEGFDKGFVVKGEHDDQPANVAKVADVKAALKEKGLLAAATKNGKKVTPEDIEKQREERVDKMLGERVHTALAKHFDADKSFGFPGESKAWLLWLAQVLWASSDADVDAARLAFTGSKSTGGVEWLERLNAETLARVVMAMALGEELEREHFPHWNIKTGDKKTANTLAKEISFDLPALRKEVADEVDGAIRDEIQALADVVAPAAKKTTATKKVKAKASTKQKSKPSPLTPEKALAKAVAKDKPAPPKATVTAAAAWPFPSGPGAA